MEMYVRVEAGGPVEAVEASSEHEGGSYRWCVSEVEKNSTLVAVKG